MYRLRFDKMIENSLDVVRLCCLSACGPVILGECLASIAFYSSVVNGCDKIHDGFNNVMIYVVIILGCVSLTVTTLCCY